MNSTIKSWFKKSGSDLSTKIPNLNLIIDGDFTVNGTTTTIDTTTLTVEDVLILLAKGNVTDSYDIGLIGQRSSNNIGFIWDESADEFACISTTDDGTTVGDVTIASYHDFQAKDITAATFLGDLNGTINTLTTGVTQTPATNNTSIATTAYTDTAIGAIAAITASNGLTRTVNDIALGGSLTGNTEIDISGRYLKFSDIGGSYTTIDEDFIQGYYQHPTDGYSNWYVQRNGFGFTTKYYAANQYQAYIDAGSNNSAGVLEFLTGDDAAGTELKFVMDTSSGIILTDTLFTKGIVYAADYSSAYTARSIPDITWVIGERRYQKRTDAGAAHYTPSVLTTDEIITANNSAAARNIVISTEDVNSGTTTRPRVMTIKDEYGNATINNLTVTLENGGTIDGSSSAVIVADYNSIDIYCTGTNAFII